MRETRTWWLAVALAASAALGSGCALDGNGDEQLGSTDQPVTTGQGGGTWFLETFDTLSIGPLGGQNGWSIFPGGDPTPTVFPQAGRGNAAKCTPPDGSGAVESVYKDFTDQVGGNHIINFSVRPNLQITEASSAKIIFDGDGANGSMKIFQVFAGTGLRVNNPTGTAWFYQPGQLQLGLWYQVTCLASFETHLLTCTASPEGSATGVTVTLGIPAGATRITAVDMFAWDFPGAVLFDDIIGVRIPSPFDN